MAEVEIAAKEGTATDPGGSGLHGSAQVEHVHVDVARVSEEVSVADPHGGTAHQSAAINDEQFIKDLEKLKDIRSFFIEEAVPLTDTRALSFGELNLLNYSRDGRPPTGEEWSKVEESTRILFSSLTDSLRRKFRLAGIPWIVAILPVIFIVVAVASLTGGMLTSLEATATGNENYEILPYYVIWLTSLGAIGAVAFIGMNALSVQEDITFDLTNRRLMVLRVVLGGLFGLVLTLPFGFQGFLDFCAGVAAAKAKTAPASGGSSVWQVTSLLAPFVLGFSTSLVILVLNHLVDGVQAFFGRGGAATSDAHAHVRFADPRTIPARRDTILIRTGEDRTHR